VGSVNTTTYQVRNQAVHLSPFLGYLWVPDEVNFFQAFTQVDVATGGNSVSYQDPLGSGSFGSFDEQMLMYVDLSYGRWLYWSQQNCRTYGLAAQFEVHYTKSLQDADTATATSSGTDFTFGSLGNHTDIVNLTAGLHFQINRTELRIGTAFPLGTGFDRAFDGEVILQINQRF
jgi:hypothetical protein